LVIFSIVARLSARISVLVYGVLYVRMFLSFIRERSINPRAEALLSIKAFRVKDCCAGSKNSADTIINLLFINLRYKDSVSNSIRLIYFIGFFLINPCSRR
jgi:hypothetical protein